MVVSCPDHFTKQISTVRYFLELSYKGSDYSGWQIQHNANSVQQTIQQALSTMLKEDIHLTGSGRTDAGVHARQQFAHFDTAQEVPKASYLRPFNALLPLDISILDIHAVRLEAHARFDAVARRYEYHIHRFKDPFLYGLSYLFYSTLDIDLMNQAGAYLEKAGKRSYACFAKTGGSHQTYDCDIFRARWHVVERDRLVFSIQANRFLRGMVRAIVGTMLDLGTHKISLNQFLHIIESSDRKLAGRSVDACGLYLCEVTYPETIFL